MPKASEITTVDQLKPGKFFIDGILTELVTKENLSLALRYMKEMRPDAFIASQADLWVQYTEAAHRRSDQGYSAA